MSAPRQLHTESFAERPAYDTAVSRALLHGVAAGRHPEALRLHRPGAVVAFSALDRAQPGFREAVAAAKDEGFGAIVRLAGGRAAVFHEATLAFAWCVSDPEPRKRIAARFDHAATVARETLLSLGVEAHIGAVPGEYCPGAHSVNARGRTKLVGIGQRIVRGAAHVGGVLVIGSSDRIRAPLGPVNAALGVDWDPSVVGSVEDEVGPVAWEDVRDAWIAAFARHGPLVAEPLPEALLRDAEAWTADHEA